MAVVVNTDETERNVGVHRRDLVGGLEVLGTLCSPSLRDSLAFTGDADVKTDLLAGRAGVKRRHIVDHRAGCDRKQTDKQCERE